MASFPIKHGGSFQSAKCKRLPGGVNLHIFPFSLGFPMIFPFSYGFSYGFPMPCSLWITLRPDHPVRGLACFCRVRAPVFQWGPAVGWKDRMKAVRILGCFNMFHNSSPMDYSNHTKLLVGGLEHLDYVPIQLGMSSSQLTNSYFSEG